MKTKRRKGPDATAYVLRATNHPIAGLYWSGVKWASLAQAWINQDRGDAVAAKRYHKFGRNVEIVPCRVVPLSARTKRSKKRTK